MLLDTFTVNHSTSPSQHLFAKPILSAFPHMFSTEISEVSSSRHFLQARGAGLQVGLLRGGEEFTVGGPNLDQSNVHHGSIENVIAALPGGKVWAYNRIAGVAAQWQEPLKKG